MFGAVKIWRRAEEPGGGGQDEEAEPDVLARYHSKARHQSVHGAFSVKVIEKSFQIVHRALSLQPHSCWGQHQLEENILCQGALQMLCYSPLKILLDSRLSLCSRS